MKYGGNAIGNSANGISPAIHTQMNVKEQIDQIFRTTVAAQVEAGNHARWGNDESVAVIRALADVAFGDLNEGFDAIEARVAQVVNPSAFAQSLETLSDGSGKDRDGNKDDRPAAKCWIRRPSRGTRRGKDSGLD